MNKKYNLELTKKAARRYKKLVLKNKELQKQIQETLIVLVNNPYEAKLKTHKVNISNYGQAYSSWATRDVRIIWEITDDKITILVLDIGGHSGRKSVYK